MPPDALVYDYAETRPLPRRMTGYSFSHTFTFVATPFPANATGFQTITFRPGSDFVWTSVNVMGSNPSAANTDPASEFFVSFFVGFTRRPLQTAPIRGSTIRGAGFDAAARRMFGVPLPIKATYFRPNEPLRVDVENRRAPPAGQSVVIDVVLNGLRRYESD